MKPEELADLIERLRARHNDTWPMQIGHGDLINEDGPAAADALAAQAVELERMREALEIIAGKRQCIDNLMGNADLARQALTGEA